MASILMCTDGHTACGEGTAPMPGSFGQESRSVPGALQSLLLSPWGVTAIVGWDNARNTLSKASFRRWVLNFCEDQADSSGSGGCLISGVSIASVLHKCRTPRLHRHPCARSPLVVVRRLRPGRDSSLLGPLLQVLSATLPPLLDGRE